MPWMVNFKEREREERVDLATLIILMKKESHFFKKNSQGRGEGTGRGQLRMTVLASVCHVNRLYQSQ